MRNPVRRHLHDRSVAGTANPAGVGVSNSTRTDTPSPHSRSRDTNDTASSECPPSAKKSSSTPTAPGPGPRRTTSHTTLLDAPWPGPRPVPTRDRVIRVRAAPCRSSFPFTVNGNASSTTTADGTMYSGSRCRRELAQLGGQTSAHGHRRPRRRRTRPAACPRGCPHGRPPRPGHLRMRWPAPPRSHPARSGTRGPSPGRPPGPRTPAARRPSTGQVPGPVHPLTRPPNGHATNRSAVSPGRPTIPRASPTPATYSSPDHARRHRLQPSSSTYTRVFATGRPIGTARASVPSPTA